MNNAPQMSLEQEIEAAVAIVRIGLDRLADAATRTEQIGPHVAVLRALRDHRSPEMGALAAVANVVGIIRTSLEEVDHDEIDDVLELLDEAQAHAEDTTGEKIDRVLEKLTPLLICQECGEQKPDVKVMEDPFSRALEPERTDHERMVLCESCATARFDES